MAGTPDERVRFIASNAGFEGSIVGRDIEGTSGAIGFNAATGVTEDLVAAGVIDQAKVTRTGLQNAASIAAMLLTTEALVADKPEPPAPRCPLAATPWAAWAA